ncbi:NAD(P)-binding domain-containing protein [Streptomyces sp. NPDC050529]|uniref:NAD(P)-binding domain-containing protein n=1 Tax=Streptomyces sp. NPDC050529 TaxID=3365624 RepID=UPI0037AF03CA
MFTRKIGILCTGNLGKTLTRRLSAAGHEVKVANPRGPATIEADGLVPGGRAVPGMGAHDRRQHPGPDIADGITYMVTRPRHTAIADSESCPPTKPDHVVSDSQPSEGRSPERRRKVLRGRLRTPSTAASALLWTPPPPAAFAQSASASPAAKVSRDRELDILT